MVECDRITEGFYLFGAGIVGEAGSSIENGLFGGEGTVPILFALVESIEGGFFFLIVPLGLPFLSLHKVDSDRAIGVDYVGLDFELVDVHDGCLELLFGGPALLFRSVRELAGGRFALEGLFSG